MTALRLTTVMQLLMKRLRSDRRASCSAMGVNFNFKMNLCDRCAAYCASGVKRIQKSLFSALELYEDVSMPKSSRLNSQGIRTY